MIHRGYPVFAGSAASKSMTLPLQKQRRSGAAVAVVVRTILLKLPCIGSTVSPIVSGGRRRWAGRTASDVQQAGGLALSPSTGRRSERVP